MIKGPPLYRRLRANLQEAAPEDGRRHSKLASTLLEQRVWGDSAALLLQQLASAAVADGALHLELVTLSKLAHNGQCPGNCHRDLQRYLSGKDTMSVPANMALALDMSGDKVHTELPLMTLHRVWSCMFEQRKDIFDIRVRGPERDFWAQLSITDPKWLAWSRLLSLRPMSHCIPYLHGDAVPMLKGNKVSMWSVVVFLLGRGTSIDVNMLMTCYWSHVENTRPENLDCDAKDKVWKYIPWDLETLPSGIHPVLDATGLPWPVCSAESKVQGQPLAGGYFLYLGLSKETWSIMPMCWVWNTGKELCIPACFAKLTGPTGLGLTTNSWAIPSCSGQRLIGELATPMRTGCSPYWQWVCGLASWTSCTQCPWEWHSTLPATSCTRSSMWCWSTEAP